MKISLLAVALLAGSVFAGWTTSTPIGSSYYNVGCGVDSGKVLLNIGFGSPTVYGLVSTDPLYSQASSLSDLSVANGNPVQIYSGSDSVSFSFKGDGGTCSSLGVKRIKILGISIDKK